MIKLTSTIDKYYIYQVTATDNGSIFPPIAVIASDKSLKLDAHIL